MIPISEVNNILIFASIVLGVIGVIGLILEYLYLIARKKIKQLEKQLYLFRKDVENSNDRAEC